MFLLGSNIFKIIFISASHHTFFSVLVVAFLNDIKFSASQIGFFFLSKRVGRLLFDIPFGILFDKIGYVYLFLISKIARLLNLFLILKYNYYYLILLAFFFEGLSEAALFGKSETCLFNFYNSRKNENRSYHKILSMFYFLVDGLIVLISLVGTFMQKKYGYSLVIQASVLLTLISIIFIPFLHSSDNAKSQKYNHSFFNSLINLANLPRNVLMNCIRLAFLNFITWQVPSLISIIMAEYNFTTHSIGTFNSLIHCTITFGSIFAYFINIQDKKIALKYYKITTFLVFIIFFTKNIYFIIFTILTYCLVYTVQEIFLINYIDNISLKKERGTRMSFVTTVESIISIVAFFLFTQASKLNLYFGVLAFFSLFIIFYFYSLYEYRRKI